MSLKEYITYLKDNPRGLWFKERWYGWGWVPVSWQGWATIFGFIAIILLDGVYLASKTSPAGDPSNADLILFFAIIAISTIIFFRICYTKGEKPHWNWGDPRKKITAVAKVS